MGGTAMQFVRVISRVEQMEIWHANRNGFSFVISYESRSGPGLQGRTGFVASWRPVDQNRSAIRVGGSPFNTLAEAEEACEAILGHLTIGPIAPAGLRTGSMSRTGSIPAMSRWRIHSHEYAATVANKPDRVEHPPGPIPGEKQ